MSVFTLVCSFAGFCGLSGCPDGHGDQSIRARIDPEAMFAEFWTSAVPDLYPWPAVFQQIGFDQDVWVLFTAGSMHGNWMLTVIPRTGEALLSLQFVAFTNDVAGARGQCSITDDSI